MKRLTVTGEPIPELKWSKDGNWLQQGDRVQVLDNAVSSVVLKMESELFLAQTLVKNLRHAEIPLEIS